MIINRDYIEKRISELVIKKQQEQSQQSKKESFLYNLKLRTPIWARKIIFHPNNPILLFSRKYQLKIKQEGMMTFPPLNIFAVDFINYCLHQLEKFDTKEYFQNQDENIIEFIDNRIKCVIAGHQTKPMNDAQLKALKEITSFKNKTTKTKNGYRLSINGQRYFLPASVDENVFCNEYGLKDLSEEYKLYISAKDFVDVGAFQGDTALMLQNYKPRKIYAYEPVSINVELLQQTINANNLGDSVEVVKKGLSDQPSIMDISISSSTSTLDLEKHGSENTESVEVSTIDHECESLKVGLVKLDVEGHEYYVIKGAEKIIKRDKPLLLISIYHTGKDFFEIPPLIRSFDSGYKFKFIDMAKHRSITDKILVAYPSI